MFKRARASSKQVQDAIKYISQPITFEIENHTNQIIKNYKFIAEIN
jgi:hypothetical protein